jgi:hypothetical protein
VLGGVVGEASKMDPQSMNGTNGAVPMEMDGVQGDATQAPQLDWNSMTPEQQDQYYMVRVRSSHALTLTQ